MITPESLYRRFKNDTLSTVSDNDARRQMLFRWVLQIIIVVCLILGSGTLLLTRDKGMGWSLYVFALVLFLDYMIVAVGKKRGVFIVTIVLNVEIFFVYIYFLVVGASDGVSAIWIVMLPPVAVLLMGRRNGSITCSLTFCVLAFFFWTDMGRGMMAHKYSDIFSIRFPILYLVIFALTLFSESIREITLTELRRMQEQMNTIYSHQYQDLQGRIQDARRARHDMRHHFVMIDTYLQDNKMDELREYVQNYYKATPIEDSLVYCEHYGTNALLTYITQRARDENVKMDVKVSFPENLPFPNEELTIVFGNLLENALEASVKGYEISETFEGNISVFGHYQGHMLLFSVKNNAARQATTDLSEHFFSTKHEGLGIGIDSVRNVAEKHNGSLDIIQTEGTFTANVMMMFRETERLT